MTTKNSINKTFEKNLNEVLADTVEKFNYSLDQYWIGYEGDDDNFPTERNVILPLAHQFLQRDIGVYGEVSFKPSQRRGAIDLIAYDFNAKIGSRRSIFLCEAKRCYRNQQYKEILKDIKKINDFSPSSTENLGIKRFSELDVYGMIAIFYFSKKRNEPTMYAEALKNALHGELSKKYLGNSGKKISKKLFSKGNKPFVYIESVLGSYPVAKFKRNRKSNPNRGSDVKGYDDHDIFGTLMFIVWQRPSFSI